MAICLILAWLILGRALTRDTVTATVFLATAATVSAGFALAATGWLRTRGWSARFAAALVLLAAGTLGFTSLLMMLHTVVRAHDLTDVPVAVAVAVAAISTVAALHNFLTLAGLAILPLALPVILAFAVLLARDPRQSSP